MSVKTGSRVILRATATDYGYQPCTCGECDGSHYQELDSGWVDPGNPYGSMMWGEVPDETCTSWPFLVLELGLRDAADYVLEFPGSVWDFAEGNGPDVIDYRAGSYRAREVTLHVSRDSDPDGPELEAAVFRLAAARQARRAARSAVSA